MKIIYPLLLLLFSILGTKAHAGFAVARGTVVHHVAIDSPEVSRPLRSYGGHKKIVPTRQVNGYGTLSLAAGLLSIAGVIALVALWPVTVGLGVALAVGTLLLGVAAILFAFQDEMNIRPHLALSVTGGLLGFLAILPVLFPVSVLVTIVVVVMDIFRRRLRRSRPSANDTKRD